MKKLIKKILMKIGLFDKIKFYVKYRKKLSKKYKFEDRKKDFKKVCFILAGYKEFTYDILFKRIKKFIPDDIEVCILSSGIYSQKLSNIAEENGWSYLSTKINNVSLIQNVANNIYIKADYIYKLDEDIFVTKNFFDTLYKTYLNCEKNGIYKVGFVAPIIPINGFGHMLVLEKYNLIKKYEKMFEKPIFAGGSDRMIENNPDVAKFMWGKDKYLPNIDEMSQSFAKDKFEYCACPIRFSIGAILYKRSLWEKMDMFEVHKGAGMGQDEIDICSIAMKSSDAIIISKNTLVGHLSFGTQNAPMKEYFEKNKDLFDIHEVK